MKNIFTLLKKYYIIYIMKRAFIIGSIFLFSGAGVSSAFFFHKNNPAVTHVVMENNKKNFQRKIDEDELKCLALNIYHEARDQSYAGQIAVGLVTINRTKDDRFPGTICEVVFDGPTKRSWKDPDVYIPIRNRCQFSWYCDGKSDDIRNENKFQEIMQISRMLLENNVIDFTDGATHYHAEYVTPGWAKSKKRTAKIDDHIFYRWEKQ